MSKEEIDFSYLNNAIKEDEIIRSKGKKKIDVSEEKNRIVEKRCSNFSRK